MARITTAQADVAENAVIGAGTTYYLSLHISDPVTSGSGEGTDGRKAITFGSSASGTQASTNSQSWSSAVGGQTYGYFGIWTAVTAGTYLRGGALTASITPAAGATISVAIGAITLTASEMALVLSEPFVNLTAAPWTSAFFTIISGGRTGSGIQSGGTSNALYDISVANQSDTLTVGFAFQVSSIATRRGIFWFRTDAGATIVNTLTVETTGALAVKRGNESLAAIGTSASGLIAINTWYYVEMQVKLHDTAGTLNVRLNGTNVIGPLTGQDTSPGTVKTVYDQIGLVGSSGGTHLFDDLYLRNDTTFQGDTPIPEGPGLILLDGLEDTSSWTTLVGAPAIVAGRSGNCCSFTSSGELSTVIPAASQSATVVVGFAFKMSVAPSGASQLLWLWGDSNITSHTGLRIDSTRAIVAQRGSSIQIGISSAGVVPVNTWCYLEAKFVLGDSPNGAVTVNIDGTNVLTVTGVDTKNAGTVAAYDTVHLHATTSSAFSFDDLYIKVGPGQPFLGDITIETLYPNGNGAANQWIGSDGDSVNNYALVNESPAVTTTYVASSAPGQQDLYTLTDLVGNGTIAAVCHVAHVARSDVASPCYMHLLNRRSVMVRGTVTLADTTYASYGYGLSTDPETGAAWTVANVNALQSGVAFPEVSLTNLQGWYDADDWSTFVYSSGVLVSQWSDKSGQSRHLVQSTVANQLSRNGTQNGRTTVTSTSNSMGMSTAAPISTAVDNVTMFAACKRTGGDSTQSGVFHNGSASANGYGVELRAGGANVGLLVGGVANRASSTPDPAAAGVLCLRRTAGTWSMYLNGTATSLAVTDVPTTPSVGTFVPDPLHFFQGEIYEIIFYDRALPDTERAQVESYLKTKWGTP